ncbi:mucin-5AC-like [Haliotis rubra]|uniref:mucin-5AC-like n=1 Tax=Haliotis rubra TaxID=36100 RepID=UPI001EE50F45|nr:mucin-5AC-like [Haliotis rubra]
MKTTKSNSHPVMVSVAESPVPTPTSTSGGPKSSDFMSFSSHPARSSPSSSTSRVQTVPPSNVPSPQTNRTSSYTSSGPMLATSNTISSESHTTTGTTYSSWISRTTTVPITSIATWLTTSKSTHGSRRSTQVQLSKTNSMSDSSSGLQFTTSSSPLLTTLGRMQTSTETSLPSTKRSSSLPQTYQPSPSMTGTLSPPLTHSTTGGIHSAGHTSYLARSSQRLSSSLFEASSSSSVTPFHLMKTTKSTSHPVTVSFSQGTVPTPSSPTSTSGGPKSSAFMSFSPQSTRNSPSSSTSMVRSVPPSNVPSPQTNRTSSYKSSGPMLATSNTISSESHTTTGTTYSSRISRTTTVPITSTATSLTTSKSTHGSRRSTQVQLSKTNSMSDSSSGLQFTTSSSPLLTTLGRMQTSTETSLPSTKRSSSLPQTYQPSPSMTGTLSPPLTHSTTGGIHSARHTSYSARPSQRLSSSLFEASSSSSVTPFHLMKTTKSTSHPVTVSFSQGTVPTPSSPTSTSRGPKSSAFMSFSPQSTRSSPSSSTSRVQTVPPSNVPSPRTNRTSSNKSSGPMLATSNTTSSESHTTTGTTYSSRISRITTVPITSTATWLTTSKSTHGSRRSTQVQLSKTNYMSDSSSGLQFTTSSSPLLTTLGRMQTSTETSLPSTKRSSSLPQTYQPSPSMTGTLSPPLTHSTTGGIHSARHTSYSARPSQRLSSSLFEASSSSSVTPFHLMKTTKSTSHPVTVSFSQGTVPTPSSPTSTSRGPKSSAFMSFSPQSTRSSPSSSTSRVQTVPPSNVPSPRTNRTSSYKSSGPMLATSNTTSSESHTTTGTTYSSRISRITTVPITSTATWLTTSKSTHGSRRSTQVHLSKTNSMSDSSSGLKYTMSSSPLLTTLGRILVASTTASLPSTKRSSSLPQMYPSSPSMTGTLSPPRTHWTTGGIHSARHTSYSTRPPQRSSSSLFEASSSSSVTPFHLMKTTKQTSHPVTVSPSQGTVPTPSSPTSTSGGPKSSAFLSLSPQSTRSSPSSLTSMKRTVPPSNVTSFRTNRSGVTTLSITPSAAEQSTGTPGTPVNKFSMYFPTVSRQAPVEESTFNTGKSGNDDDKIAFILEVITSLTGATLLILMVITTAMCLCFKKRMNELKRNSRHRNKLSETMASNLELKRRSVVSLESGYCSNSISS